MAVALYRAPHTRAVGPPQSSKVTFSEGYAERRRIPPLPAGGWGYAVRSINGRQCKYIGVLGKSHYPILYHLHAMYFILVAILHVVLRALWERKRKEINHVGLGFPTD